MDVPRTPEARFQLLVPGSASALDLLGVWQTATADGVAGDGQLVWQVDLPANRSSAAASLAQQIELLQTGQQELRTARRRLDTFTHQAQLAATGAVSFTTLDQELPTPERELAALLVAARGEQAFLLGERLVEGWQETARQAQAFLGQVRLALAVYTRVETKLGGVLIGQTIVGWLGDVKTIWWPGQAGEQAVLHQRALALALGTRAAWTRAALHIVAGAARLASLFAASGGFLAIPAAWQFIKQVLADVRQLQELSGRWHGQ
jgi:hypothetical protein